MDDYPVVYISFEIGIIRLALLDWPEKFFNYIKECKSGAFRYPDIDYGVSKSDLFN